MVLNIRGGKGAKKQKNPGTRTQGRALKTKDHSPDSCELYGKILKRLGGNPPFVLVLCEDNVERKCVIRGRFTKRVWMNANDVVIIIYNKECSDKKGEIEHKYDVNEASKLESMGEITSSMFKSSDQPDLLDNIIFANVEEDKGINDDYFSNRKPSNQKTFIADLGENSNSDDEFDIDDI